SREVCVFSSPYTHRASTAMASSRNLSIAVVSFCLCGLSTDGFMLQQRHRLRTTGLTMKKATNKSKSKPAAKPSDSSATIAAAAAAAPLSAGPSGESLEPSDAPKTGSVPSSPAASTAPVFSKRKTFWQPFLTATANPSAAAAGGTPAAQNVPEGSSPGFDPPPLPNRKSFWQPYYSPPTAAGAPPVADDSAPPAAVAEPEPPATAETESPKETESPMKEAPTVAEEVPAPTTSAAPPATEAVPPPQPAAATAASSPPSPAPPVVAFEPVPTLISDSPVYK
ncbi:unnamed protein product, partial [Ectocarpus sp. 8 AP-2014]